jgi:hypothetical protein
VSRLVVVPNTSTGARGQGNGGSRACYGAIALLVFQPVFFFWRVLINPRAHIPFDLEGFHLPLIAYVAELVRRGVAPLWDPYFYAGVPIHADSQAQLFYPLNWLAILAAAHGNGQSLFYWVEFMVPLHMILAGLFTFWLLRRLGVEAPAAFFGATVYQLGGYFASQAQHLGAVCCGAWLPLVILAIFENRARLRLRWICILGLAVAMSILAGFMATTLVIGITAGLMVAGLLATRQASWRIIPATAIGFLTGALISTVELIPLWHLAQVSIASLRGAWYVTGGGLPLESLASLIIPNFYHIFEPGTAYKLPYNFTFLYIYCGFATTVLWATAAFFGRSRERACFALTVICAVWMLGEHTPVYRSIFTRLPQFLRGVLYAEYALMAFCFFGGLTAALMLHRFTHRIPATLVWGIALFTSFDLIRAGSGRPMNSASGGYKQENPGNAIRGSAEIVDRLRELVNQTSPPSRIDFLDGYIDAPITAAETFRLPTANGSNPFLLQRMQKLRLLFCAGAWWERLLFVNRPGSPLLDMLNVGWLVGGTPLSDAQVQSAGLVTIQAPAGISIYQNPRALPRFFLASRIRRSPDQAATFRLLADPGFRPAKEAIVENIAADRVSLSTAPVNLQEYTPNRIRLTVTTAGEAFLVTSEAMYLGWQATINGKPQPLLMTNGVFRGLMLPAGANEIVMEYHPPYLGLYLSFSGVLALLTISIALRGGERRQKARQWWNGKWPLEGRHRLALAMAPVKRHAVTIRWLLLFVPTITLFYWKILLTNQFSLLTESEGVNQAYSWLRFWISTVRHGVLPMWDPYTFSGHSFVGEMQTAAFYPLHLVLALFPLNRDHVLSPFLYNAWWAGAHLMGAVFLFLLVREFGLGRFAAFTAGVSFALGGFVSRLGWPHMLESSIWLPLIFLFLLRAFRAEDTRGLLRSAALGGISLGMAILAGGFHVVIMQVLVIVSAACFYAISAAQTNPSAARWRKAGIAAAVLAGVGLAAGAVQLLPSMEYSARAVRFLGAPGGLPATQKIPYQYMHDFLSPHGIMGLLMPIAFNGNTGSGEVINPYLGIFPLLAAVIGIRRHWTHPWVRYLAGLAAASLLYSLGPFSWLHGVLYAVVPKLWMAREASRMVYLADFAISVLAAFGIETLFACGREASWKALNQVLLALAIACAVCLFTPAVFGKPEISPWISLSLLLIFASYGLFRWIVHAGNQPFLKVLLVVLILFDLSAFDWTARNIIDVRATGVDHLQRNLSFQGVVQFLNAQRYRIGSPFRVQVAVDPQPNLGDFSGIPTIGGGGVTMLADYWRLMPDRDLLNVRYIVKPSSTPEPGAVYQDSFWKVYENPAGRSRAWLVHEILADPGDASAPSFDAGRTALLDSGTKETIDPPVKPEEGVLITAYEANRLELAARASSRAMVVLSEIYDPGWHAAVNGAPQRIYRVDRGLRGIVVPPGESRLVLEYRPLSVYAGAVLSIFAFLGVGYFCTRRSSQKLRPGKEVS